MKQKNYINLKEKLEEIKNISNSNTKINQIIKLKNQIKNIDINNYELYYLLIDTTMLLGIEYYLNNRHDKARKLFKEVVNFGEKYHNYSKMNYYDIINCAYSWLVYYCYNENKYKEAKKYCKKVLDNYLEVKNDANYFVLEKESVDICKKYLEEIKKNS